MLLLGGFLCEFGLQMAHLSLELLDNSAVLPEQ